MQINITSGQTRIRLTKREQKTLADAAAIIRAISNNTGGAFDGDPDGLDRLAAGLGPEAPFEAARNVAPASEVEERFGLEEGSLQTEAKK